LYNVVFQNTAPAGHQKKRFDMGCSSGR